MVNKTKPFFSIVIPLFNKENEIEHTIKSVLAQVFTDFELIIVNDGSTDNSLQVVMHFSDSRIKLINKINGGVSNARNVGISEAIGSYVAFLDADDIWLPEYLKEVKLLIENFNNCKFFGTNYTISLNRLDIDNNKIYKHKLETNYFKDAIYVPLCMPSSTVVARDCFNNEFKFDERQSHGEDLDLWMRLIKKNSQMVFLNRKLVFYNQSADNRACLSIPKPHKHFAYYFQLKNLDNAHEKKYYLYQISSLCWIYLRRFKFKFLIIMLFKYKKFSFAIFSNILNLAFSNKYKMIIKNK